MGAVVVGGGISGAAVAFHLAAAGLDGVVLVERDDLAAATTGRSSAVVGAFYGGRPECELALLSLAEIASFAEVVGGDPGFHQVGLLEVAGPEDAEQLRAAVERRRAVGVGLELLAPAEVRERFPAVEVGDLALATFEARAGFAEPAVTTRAYAAAAERRGARVLTGVTVERLVVEGGRVAGVATSAGDLAAPLVVVASGAGALPLLAGIGVDLGLAPRAVEWAEVHAPGSPAGLPALLDDVQGSWARSHGDTHLAGLELVAGAAGTDLDAGWFGELCLRKLTRRLRLPEARVVATGSVTVGMSPDGRPIVGPAPGVEGLFVLVGDSGISFKFAPGAARSLAESVVGGASRTFDLTPFGPGRFASAAAWAPELRPGARRRSVHLTRELRAAARAARPVVTPPAGR